MHSTYHETVKDFCLWVTFTRIFSITKQIQMSILHHYSIWLLLNPFVRSVKPFKSRMSTLSKMVQTNKIYISDKQISALRKKIKNTLVAAVFVLLSTSLNCLWWSIKCMQKSMHVTATVYQWACCGPYSRTLIPSHKSPHTGEKCTQESHYSNLLQQWSIISSQQFTTSTTEQIIYTPGSAAIEFRGPSQN